jgi:dimethylglycine dehydrogenase
MKSQYRVVVIGGGVVGASVLYHLTKLGWTDIALIERDVLTCGSSWHAAGGFHALNADPNIAALQAYTINLLSEIEQESGQSVGMHMTGGVSLASAPERWEWLQSSYRVFQTMGIEDVRLVGPAEILELCPIANVEDVIGGLYDRRAWCTRDGSAGDRAQSCSGLKQRPCGGWDVIEKGTVSSRQRCGQAGQRGAEVIEHNRVLELKQRPCGGWDVITEKGTVLADQVVNAGGLWAKQVGRMAGIELPVTPMEHHYLLTEAIPEVAELERELPLVVDLEGFTYMRQEQQGMLVGIYETNYRHWQMEGAPWNYGVELLQEDVDRISNELELGFRRYPCLQRTGIKRWVNGAFTFSPDGNPLVGPVRGVPGYWVACGVMAGFLQGGGVGKSLAEWIVHGEPEADVYGMDIARYGDFAANREYIRQTTGQFYSRRFVMSYPNEQLPAGRPLRTAGAHDAMTAAGARWGNSWGMEVPLYFAPDGFVEYPTLRRSNAHDIVAAECRGVRKGVGLLDITAFSRYEVTGTEAHVWLDRVFACALPAPGKAKLAPMLAPGGKLKGDMTVFNWGSGVWWIIGSYYLRQWHMRWFEQNALPGVSVRDISDDMVGFSVAGPNAATLLQRITNADVSAIPFMGCGELDVGLLRTKVGRLSVTGELGYEIHCRANEHATLRRTLLQAGKGLDAIEYGFNALLSLRLEKSFGIWSREFTQAYTPGMTGMDRWIAFDKGAFLGHEAALREREVDRPQHRLVTLQIDSLDADASGYEPVWREGRRVGFVTSGGYGHTVDKSLAMALVDVSQSEPGTTLSTHIVGKERGALVIPSSPYDPTGSRMRGASSSGTLVRGCDTRDA